MISLHLYDPRPELNPDGGAKFITTHENVPLDLCDAAILARYGVAEHILAIVVNVAENSRSNGVVMQAGAAPTSIQFLQPIASELGVDLDAYRGAVDTIEHQVAEAFGIPRELM